jgi:hypothetical protein
VAADGWENTGGRPAGGAQAGWLRCGSTPVVLRSGRGRGGAERLGSCVGLLGRRWTGRHELEKGGARELVHGQDAGACCGWQWRARTGRWCVAFIGGRGSGSMARECCGVGRLPRSARAALAGAPGRRTGDEPLVQGMARTSGAEHDAFSAFKASGGEP